MNGCFAFIVMLFFAACVIGLFWLCNWNGTPLWYPIACTVGTVILLFLSDAAGL